MNAGATTLSSREDVVQASPFPHAVLHDVLPPELADMAMAWLEREAAWRLERSSFYTQYGCRNIAALAEHIPYKLWDALAAHMAQLFGASLTASRARLSAHRLLPGQGIGIHNDDPHCGTETHRLVVTFTRAHEDGHGGHLVLFHRRDPAEVAQIVRPLPGVGIAFPLSSKSWHAVSDVVSGTRYSLIFSFWEGGAPCELVGRVHGVQPHQDLSPQVPRAVLPEHWYPVVALLERLGAATVPHSGATLLNHLIGTGLMLEVWGCARPICAAGMAHSVYGTPSFDHALLAHDERHLLANAIGAEAEALAFRFGQGDIEDPALTLVGEANRLEQEMPR